MSTELARFDSNAISENATVEMDVVAAAKAAKAGGVVFDSKRFAARALLGEQIQRSVINVISAENMIVRNMWQRMVAIISAELEKAPDTKTKLAIVKDRNICINSYCNLASVDLKAAEISGMLRKKKRPMEILAGLHADVAYVQQNMQPNGDGHIVSSDEPADSES